LISYPIGTLAHPVNNDDDAILIAAERGFKRLHIVGNSEFDTDDLSGFTVRSNQTDSCHLTVSGACITNNTTFKSLTLYGDLNGIVEIYDCAIRELTGLQGHVYNSVLESTIVLGGTHDTNFVDCYDGIPGSATPVIDCGSGRSLGLWNYSGGIKLINKTGNEGYSVNLNAGKLVVDSSCVSGSIILRGIGSLVGTTGGTTIDTTGLISNPTITSIMNTAVAGIGVSASSLTTEQHNKLMSLPIKQDIADIFEIDPSFELSSVPSVTAPLKEMIQYVFQYFRNKRTVSGTQEKMYKADGTLVGTSSLGDDGTTFTRDKMQ
jgi:hypothetical protein